MNAEQQKLADAVYEAFNNVLRTVQDARRAGLHVSAAHAAPTPRGQDVHMLLAVEGAQFKVAVAIPINPSNPTIGGPRPVLVS